MRAGARLNIAFIRTGFRRALYKKCPVCLRAIRGRQNKTGLCSHHYNREHQLNTYHQGFLK